MRLRIKWGEEFRSVYETSDFTIDPGNYERQIMELLAHMRKEKVAYNDNLAPFRIELVGGTTAVRWFYEQLIATGRLHNINETDKLESLLQWFSDVYAEGAEEAGVLIAYMQRLGTTSKSYSRLKNYRELAEDDSSKHLYKAVQDSSLREALVQAKIVRYERKFMPPDPNEAADNEAVIALSRFDNGYLVVDRVDV